MPLSFPGTRAEPNNPQIQTLISLRFTEWKLGSSSTLNESTLH